MTLTQFSFSANPINVFIQSLSAQLASVVDNNNIKVNQSVAIGLDAIFKSAIDGKPASSDMPCIRIFYDPYNVQVDNAQSIGLYNNVNIDLYCLFAVDYPDPNFSLNRDSY